MPPPHAQPRPKPPRLLRPALLKLHRWAGLALAAFLVLTGLTGAVMAWTDELDALLNPRMLRTPGTPALDAAQLLALALEPGQAAMLRVAAAPGAGTGTGADTQLGFGEVRMAAQYPLHSGRILGWPGRALVSLLGLAVAVISATGVLLWLRKRRAGRG